MPFGRKCCLAQVTALAIAELSQSMPAAFPSDAAKPEGALTKCI